MLLALAPLVFSVLAPPALRDPPIRIKLSDDVYLRGERARVKVKTIENGYLLVVRADAQGRIRVLFPQEPGGAAAIRGGREVEIRGRGAAHRGDGAPQAGGGAGVGVGAIRGSAACGVAGFGGDESDPETP